MYKNILTPKQIELLPLVKSFSKEYYLVGGTAIALHIGHRRSVDFDLFNDKKVRNLSIKNNIRKNNFSIQKVLYEDVDQIHLIVNSVKLTFYRYLYPIEPSVCFDDIILVPSLLDLATMKALALGGRAKWKDYVDIYFLLKYHYSISDITKRAKTLFQDDFSEKLFRQQMCYFNDIDYSEAVEFVDNEVVGDEIKSFLVESATTSF